MVLDEAFASVLPAGRSPPSLLPVPRAEMLFLRLGGEDVHFGFCMFFEPVSKIVGLASEEKLLDLISEKSCLGLVSFGLCDSEDCELQLH